MCGTIPDLLTKVKFVPYGAVLSKATLEDPLIFLILPGKAWNIFYPFKSKTYLELPQDWEIKLNKAEFLASSKVQRVK